MRTPVSKLVDHFTVQSVIIGCKGILLNIINYYIHLTEYVFYSQTNVFKFKKKHNERLKNVIKHYIFI